MNEYIKMKKDIRARLYKVENKDLLKSLVIDGGNLTHLSMERFKEVFGEDWIIWIKCYSGNKCRSTVRDYFKIINQEANNLENFDTPGIKKMLEDFNNDDPSKWDGIEEVYISNEEFIYFCL